MASTVYLQDVGLGLDALVFLEAGVQISLAEPPGLALDTGQDVAFYFALPRPLKKRAGSDPEIAGSFIRS